MKNALFVTRFLKSALTVGSAPAGRRATALRPRHDFFGRPGSRSELPGRGEGLLSPMPAPTRRRRGPPPVLPSLALLESVGGGLCQCLLQLSPRAPEGASAGAAFFSSSGERRRGPVPVTSPVRPAGAGGGLCRCLLQLFPRKRPAIPAGAGGGLCRCFSGSPRENATLSPRARRGIMPVPSPAIPVGAGGGSAGAFSSSSPHPRGRRRGASAGAFSSSSRYPRGRRRGASAGAFSSSSRYPRGRRRGLCRCLLQLSPRKRLALPAGAGGGPLPVPSPALLESVGGGRRRRKPPLPTARKALHFPLSLPCGGGETCTVALY